MEAAESEDLDSVHVKTTMMSSYGACRNETATVDTPSQNYRFRLWTVSCSCMVAIQTWFIYGYAIGYTAPVLNDLGTLNSTYISLSRTSYQDTFSVRCTHNYYTLYYTKLSMVYVFYGPSYTSDMTMFLYITCRYCYQ